MDTTPNQPDTTEHADPKRRSWIWFAGALAIALVGAFGAINTQNLNNQDNVNKSAASAQWFAGTVTVLAVGVALHELSLLRQQAVALATAHHDEAKARREHSTKLQVSNELRSDELDLRRSELAHRRREDEIATVRLAARVQLGNITLSGSGILSFHVRNDSDFTITVTTIWAAPSGTVPTGKPLNGADVIVTGTNKQLSISSATAKDGPAIEWTDRLGKWRLHYPDPPEWIERSD